MNQALSKGNRRLAGALCEEAFLGAVQLEWDPVEAPQHGERFSFGGVGFEVLVDPSVAGWELASEHLSCLASLDTRVGAHVLCSVTADPSLDDRPFSREIRWEWGGTRAQLETARVDAMLTRLSHGRYAATARIVPDSNGASSLVTALASAIVSREGGVMLHASGIELDDGVVLFIGPSGAGKTTACNRAPGARAFTRDRAAVVPCATSPTGWAAWRMPGGDEIALPSSHDAMRPLLGILRVRRGDDGVSLQTRASVSAVVLLRESAQSGGRTEEDEQRHVRSLLALATAVPIGELRSVLSASLTGPVREWLERPSRERWR